MANSPSFLEMRRRNADDILRLVRQKPGISRAELAKEARLAKATVSGIVDELLHKQVLLQVGIKPSSGGRPAMGLRFNELCGLAVGVSLDKSELAVCILDLDGKLVREFRQSLSSWLGPSAGEFVIASIEKALLEMGFSRERLFTIGAAIPSHLVTAVGRQVKMVAGDYGIALRMLQEHFDCELILDSNTNMSAVAEISLSNIAQSDLALVMRLGDSVRTAVVVNGQVLSGHQALAGGLGHMYLPTEMCQCSCGKIGCLNTVAGTDGMLARYKQSGRVLQDFNELIACARHGEEKAIEIFSQAGKAAAYGLAAAVNMLAPNTVILSGPALGAGELILEPLLETFKAITIEEIYQACKVVVGSHSFKAEGYGAGLNALQKLTSIPGYLSLES